MVPFNGPGIRPHTERDSIDVQLLDNVFMSLSLYNNIRDKRMRVRLGALTLPPATRGPDSVIVHPDLSIQAGEFLKWQALTAMVKTISDLEKASPDGAELSTTEGNADYTGFCLVMNLFVGVVKIEAHYQKDPNKFCPGSKVA